MGVVKVTVVCIAFFVVLGIGAGFCRHPALGTLTKPLERKSPRSSLPLNADHLQRLEDLEKLWNAASEQKPAHQEK